MSTALESEIGQALTRDDISAADLEKLILKVEAEIVTEEAKAKRYQEEIYNLDSDPKAANEAYESCLIAAGRLRTAETRLFRKKSSAETIEQLANWNAEFEKLKAERDHLADELVDIYPEAAAKLIDLFTRLNAFDARLHQLHVKRPSGVPTLLAPELEVRNLERFTRDKPSITAVVQLFDLNNTEKKLWPPVVPRDMGIFAPLPYNPRYSGEWHKYQEEEANARRRESERVFVHYEAMAKERAEREHREDQERWKNASGASK